MFDKNMDIWLKYQTVLWHWLHQFLKFNDTEGENIMFYKLTFIINEWCSFVHLSNKYDTSWVYFHFWMRKQSCEFDSELMVDVYSRAI